MRLFGLQDSLRFLYYFVLELKKFDSPSCTVLADWGGCPQFVLWGEAAVSLKAAGVPSLLPCPPFGIYFFHFLPVVWLLLCFLRSLVSVAPRHYEELNEQLGRPTAMHEYESDDTDIETTLVEEEAEVSGQTSLSAGNATAGMSESAVLVSTMAKLLKTQTEAIQAQTQVAAAQHLPPLKPFTGEDMQVEEGTFDSWLELFEERAKLTCWGPAQRLHHLKLLLEKTALKAFQVTDREDYDKATAALCKRFKLVDIEELRGLEFHHRIQGKETIEELGMGLQTLRCKAFPSSSI